MKKKYTGLRAEKVNFGEYDVIACSIPSSCIEIVANLLGPDNKCTNPENTTSKMWVGNNPYE